MKDKITTLLRSTCRDGMDDMIEWMETNGYFTSPASTRFHGCYEGGLAKHSFGVYTIMHAFNQELALGVEEDSVIIATLLHDLCKVGLYLGSGKPYKSNKGHPKGHARLSIEIAQKYIELLPIEQKMIRFHMGPWNSTGYCTEYSVRDMLKVWGKYDAVRWMYFADELATREEKVEEGI